MEAPADDGNVETFHHMLERRVEEWLASGDAKKYAFAELYRHLPGLFLLLTNLAVDARVPESERAAILSSLKYVVVPFDLIPEGVVGTSGFRDDLVLAALVVDRLGCRVGHEVVMDHWHEPGDPFQIATTILDVGTSMVGAEICDRLREWLPQ